MDQVKETSDLQEVKSLLRELLQMQELLLHRIEKLEEAVRKK